SLSLTPVVYMLKVGIHDINNNICVFSLYHKDYVVCISLDIDSVDVLCLSSVIIVKPHISVRTPKIDN
ncbi:hypothetical protein J6590_101401, partial [Homalodisca vitripennis]